MDFLDSIDIQVKDQKSNRVRSWYLYEQFKSLERHQLDAAQKLKDRSYQDRILRQELSERKARRKLYNQVGFCNSDSCIEKGSSVTESTLSASTDDFFERFCEVSEDNKLHEDCDLDVEDAYNQDDSQTEKDLEDFKSLDDLKDDQSLTESMNSVVQNYKSNENFTEELKEEIKHVERSIAEEINLQLETVQENIHCLEKYSKMCSDDKIMSENDSSESCEDIKQVSARSRQGSDINLYNMWSKLVSFAYQAIQLNHGSCYYDYSSQVLTAVLACDVLRRGVSRMCHILQPYVSPIKYATDDTDASITNSKNFKRKKINRSKRSKKQRNKIHTNNQSNKCRSHKKYCSDDYWQSSFGYKNREQHGCSDQWRSSAKFSTCRDELSDNSRCSIWPSFSGTSTCDCPCPCHVKVVNPMVKIGHYIDRLLNEIDDCEHM